MSIDYNNNPEWINIAGWVSVAIWTVSIFSGVYLFNKKPTQDNKST